VADSPSFVRCKQCGRAWPDRTAFLADPQVRLSGCQVETDRPEASVFLFDHRAPGCGTTIAIKLPAFDDLYAGPRHKVKWGASAKCAKKCHDPKNLEACTNPCAAAHVRQILRKVMEMNQR